MSSPNTLKPRPAYSGFDGQFIAGSWRPGHQGETEVDINPYYSGEVLAETAMASAEDLDEAYRAADRAQAGWAALLAPERAVVMFRSVSILEVRHGEIVDGLIREAGSTRYKAELEWQFFHSITVGASFPYRMEGTVLPLNERGKDSRSYRQPLGVIGVISPVNFPMHPSHRSIGPALALGNGVVVKPAPDTPVTGGLLIAKIYEEAGLPPGLLNVVIGPVKEIGDPFKLHPVPSLISFTGSTPVGRHIGQLAMQGPRIKRVSLELGGNAPFVVLDDADLDRAVPAAVAGRFLHQGQVCMSTNRFIVDAKVHDEFAGRFTEQVKALKRGDPSDPEVAIGPIINQKQVRSRLSYISSAREAEPGNWPAEIPRARCCRRTCSPRSTTTCPWPRRRPSAGSRPSSRSAGKPRRCTSRTTRHTGCPAPCSPATRTAGCVLLLASAPG